MILSRIFSKRCPILISRSFHVSHPKRDDYYDKILFKINGYYKFGLLHDDLYQELEEDVIEALRRLPEEELMQRTYRAIRASQAELNNSILPKEQWSKFEDNHFYLKPYIDEVKREKEERREWEANH